MLKRSMGLSLTVALVVGGAIASTNQCVFAQSITLDGTLGTARTLNGKNYIIQQADGQTVGNNLFHSFGRFSLSKDEMATFRSGTNIQNIISRVTGGSPSTIDGLIYTESRNVNLFLINPSGIVFGPNASLNIGSSTRGSFVATTLDGLVWSNGGQFSATNPGGPSSLLTLVGDPSGFLSSLRPPQPISTSGSNLAVPEGQSLLLLGGNLTLDKGNLTPEKTQSTVLTAPGGQIELAGVTGAGTVGLGINGNILKLNIPDNITRGDVSLVNDSQIVVSPKSTRDGGDINIKGGYISINNQNTIALDASAQSAQQVGRTGNISLDATGSIFITGSDTKELISTFGNNKSLGSGNISLKANGDISLNDAFFVASSFGGNAGNISLEANKSISLANNSSLVSTAFSRGNSGNITVKSLLDSVSLQNSLVSTAVGFDGDKPNPNLGNAGNITIRGNSISVTGGAEISSRSFSGLNSGNIEINGTDEVEISGRVPVIPLPNKFPDNARATNYFYTSLATTSEKASIGMNAGDINIFTKNLRISDGAILRSESNSNARGGNININASTFDLTGGSQLITTAFSTGNAGDVNLNVQDHVFISGINPEKSALFKFFADAVTKDELGQANDDGSPKYTPKQAQADGTNFGTTLVGIVDPNSLIARSGIFANTLGTSTAKGGNVNITTGRLQVENQGSITVSSPSGQAGDLTITAKDIRLNQGSLTADTEITGANITLQGLDLLLLQNGSLISAKASNNATGGNITINARNGVVVAPLLQNNDIIASAVGGKGGNITISSEQIFGLTKGSSIPENRTNDVDASSEFNSPGTVTFNTLDIDPSLGLITLPTVVVDASKLVDTSCAAASQTKFNELTITGRGGLPPNPYDPLTSDAIWSDTRLPNIVSVQKLSESQRLSNQRVPLETKDHIAIVPATGWIFNNKGEVTLIANSSGNVPSNTSSCPKR